METTTGGGAVPGEQAFTVELVRLSGVHKYYGGGLSGVHALHDIHLRVGTGEMVAICGPSGSGKTSLLNVVGMLDTATEGAVVLDHLLVSKLSEQARATLRAEMIGYVFQAFSLIPVMSARDNVLLPLLLRSRLQRDELAVAQQRADDLLAQVGLATQSSHFPARLDASQSQRVAIVRALITRPRLVIADEPAARLDGGCVRMVMELFARQQRDHGTAFLISTRDQRQLSRATRTIQINEGRLLSNSADAARRPVRVQL
jgi:putative ABC transport system ATP-binding protein